MIFSCQQRGELRAPSYDAFRYDAMENRWRKSFKVCCEPRSCPIISVQSLRVKSLCSGFPGGQRGSFVTPPENFQVEQDGVSQVRAEIRTRGVVYEHKNGASAGLGILDPRVCVARNGAGRATEETIRQLVRQSLHGKRDASLLSQTNLQQNKRPSRIYIRLGLF